MVMDGESQIYINKFSVSTIASENITLDPAFAKSTIQIKATSPKSRQQEPNYFSMKCPQNELARWSSIPSFKKPPNTNRKVYRKTNIEKDSSIMRVNLTSREYFNKSIQFIRSHF
jgi:hypothetical protein